MATLTQGLVDLIRSRDVGPDDLHKAALFALDAVANAIAGRNSEPGQTLLKWSQSRALDPGRRAFIIGGLTHILEVDDIHRASVVHTGCVTVPAVLALGAEKQLAGKVLLKAVLFGFEAACRVGMAVGKSHYRIWHNTATCGPFGSAMAAATLLDLDDEKAMHALGNAGTQSAGVWEFLKTGAMSKHLHAGRAAEAGVVSAELAEQYFTGPPEILEGNTGLFAAMCPDPDPDAVLRDPKAPWQVNLTSIKPWPSCRHTHPTIDAAIDLSGQVEANAIRSISVKTYGAAIDVCDRPVANTTYEAKFSLQHCVAAALQMGRVDFSAFDEQARKNAADLALRVSVGQGPNFEEAYPGAWGASVEVETEQGNILSSAAPECRGDPELALNDHEMIEKARELMRFGGINDPERIIHGILNSVDGGEFPDTAMILSAA